MSFKQGVTGGLPIVSTTNLNSTQPIMSSLMTPPLPMTTTTMTDVTKSVKRVQFMLPPEIEKSKNRKRPHLSFIIKFYLL